MRKIHLLIFTFLYIFCIESSAQENPFMEMVGKRYAEYSNDFWEYYKVFATLDTVQIKKMVVQLKEVTDKTGSKEWELESQYAESALLDAKYLLKGETHSEEIIQIRTKLLEKAVKENIPQLELKLIYSIINIYWYRIKNYELAFEQCALLDKRLMDVSTDDIPEKAMYLIQIADAHYFFKDYPKAISYYSKILEEKENINNQNFIQHARNGLGLCYRNGYNNYDSSDYYFQAMTQMNYLNTKKEFLREVWNGIAEGNLGYNMFQRGEYEQALPLLVKSFEAMTKHNDYAYASGVATNLADIYLRKGNLREAKNYIDIAIEYNKTMSREGRQARIYEVLSKYYTATGDKKLSMDYMDSTLQANKEYEEQFNAMLLLRMEQKESTKQQQELAREKEIRKQVQIRLLMISGGFVVISVLSVLLFVFYRRKRRAYLGLYHQIKEQDRLEEELETMPGTKQQRELVSRLREFLLKDNYFATFDIDIQELVPEMATNRANLFRALKAVTGKTPMEYINYLRLDEAKRLLDNTNLTIETIASECGFNTARTFYRQFRDRYQITPAEYRNIAKSQG